MVTDYDKAKIVDEGLIGMAGIRRRVSQKLKGLILKLTKIEVLVLGDSHAKVFRDEYIGKYFPNHIFNVVLVGGATASGLENPNSVTGANSIFLDAIEKSRANKIIFLLGEVDTGFVIWYRQKKYGTSVEDMTDKAVSSYMKLIHKAASNHRPIVISAPLPTIEDGNDWGEIANFRREVTATQYERTQLTIKFNKKVAELCKCFGYDYIDLDDESLGDKGLVKMELLSMDKNDHHYNYEVYAELVSRQINKLL